MPRTPQRLPPIHPGEILREEFIAPKAVSINALARELSVPPGRISQIVRGRRAVTADTALRLGRYCGLSPRFWLNLLQRGRPAARRAHLLARRGAPHPARRGVIP